MLRRTMKHTALSGVLVLSVCLTAAPAHGQSVSLQDIVNATAPLPRATIYLAKEVVTLDPARPTATAVAVIGDRILATGSLEELQAAAGEQPYVIDETFADKVIVHTAVNRTSRSGEVIGPDQRVSPFIALKSITEWAAWQYFEEDRKGTLTPGKLSDFVILDGDPTQVEPSSIRDIQVLETIKEGRTVFQTEGG
jgi:predicted amidohydrolase YtcJ